MIQITTIVNDFINYNTFNISNDKLIKIIKEEIPEFYYYLQKCEDEIEYFDFTLNFFINDYLFQMNNIMIDNNDYTEYNNIVLKRLFLILVDNLFKIKN